MLSNYLSLDTCAQHLATSWPPKSPFPSQATSPQILTRERRSSSGETYQILTQSSERGREHPNDHLNKVLAQQNSMIILSHNFPFSAEYCNLLNLDQIKVERAWRETRKSFGSAEFAFLYQLKEWNVVIFPEKRRSIEHLNGILYAHIKHSLRSWGYNQVPQDRVRKGDLVLYLNRTSQVAHYAVMVSSTEAISKFTERGGVFRHTISSADEFHRAESHRFYRKDLFHNVLDKLNWAGVAALQEGKLNSMESLKNEESSLSFCKQVFDDLKGESLELLESQLLDKALLNHIRQNFRLIELKSREELDYIRSQIPRIYNPQNSNGLKIAVIKSLESQIRDLFTCLVPNFST